ncbi:DUF6300 family protein [Streptomyces sp. NPDC004533]|uniref:DUF6300 family protein n=1 Tax=unclassified Streptomyces TaxID=2593676 RepID=UPI0033B660F3
MARSRLIGKKPEGESILFKIEETPLCPRCGKRTLLLTRYQHSWTNGRGEDIASRKEAALCPACDHKDQAAAELLALFAVDGQVSTKNAEAFAGLLAAWIESVRHRTVDEVLLADEYERWQRGDL